MANPDQIGGHVVQKFLDAWYKHPLSLCIVMLFLDLSFIYLLVNNKLDSTDSVVIARYTFIFSGIVLAGVFSMLLLKKEALYNAVDGLMYDMTHRIHILDEIFKEFQLGINPHEERLDRLCPKLAKYPIKDYMREQVITFEFLIHALNDCGINKKLDDQTYLALSKFYYKEGKFQKALEKIIKITSNKYNYCRPGEVEFCKGMILKSLDRKIESKEQFLKAKAENHIDAKCCLCTSADDFQGRDVQEFIETAQECANTHRTIEYCLYKLSTRFFLESKKSIDSEHRNSKLKKAYDIVDIQIKMFDDWTAHYSMACIKCLAAQYNLIPDNKHNGLKKEIIYNLSKSFSKKPALVRYCIDDEDLNWIKDTDTLNYNALLGEFYKMKADLL